MWRNCKYCGSLSSDEVYSEEEIYEEWLEYRYICMTPEEIREMKSAETIIINKEEVNRLKEIERKYLKIVDEYNREFSRLCVR